MRSRRIVPMLCACAVIGLGLSVRVWAGDTAAADRALTMVETDIKDANFDRAENNLSMAEDKIGKLTDAEKPPYVVRLEAATKAIAAGQARKAIAGLLSAAERAVGQVESDVKNRIFSRTESSIPAAMDKIGKLPEAEQTPFLKRIEAAKAAVAAAAGGTSSSSPKTDVSTSTAPKAAVSTSTAPKAADSATASPAASRLLRSIQRSLDDDGRFYTTPDEINKTYLSDVEKRINSDEVKAVLDEPTRTRLLEDVAAKRKARLAAVANEKIADVESRLTRVESSWDALSKKLAAGTPKQSYEVDAMNLGSSLKGLGELVNDLPPSDAQQKISDRYEKVAGPYKAAMRKANVGEALEKIKGHWDGLIADAKGWESETANTFEQFTGQQPTSYGLAKTAKAIIAAQQLLESPRMVEYGDDPSVKPLRDEAIRCRDEGCKKWIQAVNAIMDAAEKKGINKDIRDNLNASWKEVDNALWGTPMQQVTVGRIRGAIDRFDAQANAEARAKIELFDKLVKEAAAAWPPIAARHKAADGIDPAAVLADLGSKKGQVIRLKAIRNRLGWEFHDRTYDFVGWVNGQPVCGTYDAAVKAPVKDVESRTGKEIGDLEFDVIGVIDSACKVDERWWSRAFEEWRPKTTHRAPLLKIVALHAGPVAAPAGQ